jgi:glyoxylase-like metal-dependent hydrolase (beta-lactamase superfamily II)
MHTYICATCGTQYAPSLLPPDECAICTDDRQYVAWHGQRWTTPAALMATHSLRVADDNGLLGIDIAESFGIPQRALLLPTDAGNILWECLSLVTPGAISALQARGGVDRIVISHPHFYAAMVDWSEALGGVPILLHEADREWVQYRSPRIEHWRGDQLTLSPAVTLLRLGGHFPGSTALHWRDGPRAGGALFPGDAMQVAMDRQHVGFMYSYPNNIPMPASAIREMQTRLTGFTFAEVFGYSRGRNISDNGRAAVDASIRRALVA